MEPLLLASRTTLFAEGQQRIIISAVARIVGAGSRVWLFGSRADDAWRGGDIDLNVGTDAVNIALPVARAANLPMRWGAMWIWLSTTIVATNRYSTLPRNTA